MPFDRHVFVLRHYNKQQIPTRSFHIYSHPSSNPLPTDAPSASRSFQQPFNMARPAIYSIDAACGCSLTACANGLFANPDPRAHLCVSLGDEIWRKYGGDGHSEVRRRLYGMLGLGQDFSAEERSGLGASLPDYWKALIRGAVRKDPHLNGEEKNKFYRALSLGLPSAEEQAAWYVYLGHHFHISVWRRVSETSIVVFLVLVS